MLARVALMSSTETVGARFDIMTLAVAIPAISIDGAAALLGAGAVLIIAAGAEGGREASGGGEKSVPFV